MEINRNNNNYPSDNYSFDENNTNNYSPSDPSNSESNKENEKRFNYLVSLKKKHIYFASIIVILMFCFSFFMGLFFGYQYSDQKINQIIDSSSTPPFPVLKNDKNILLGENSNIKKSQILNQESELIFDQNIASDELLKKDLSTKVKGTLPKTINQPKINNLAKVNSIRPLEVIPTPGNEYYYIQVIATSFELKAKKIYQEFKKRDYPVKVKKIDKSGKQIFQIRLGLYQNKNRAIRHLKQTRNSAGYKDANLFKYRI